MTDATTFTLTPAGLAALDAYAPDMENGSMAQDTPNAPETLSGAPAGKDGHCGMDAETFTPDTAQKVDWVLSKIADAKGRAARIREHAEAMAKQAEAEAAFMEWKYGAALQAFARRELEGGRRKSLTLYHGVLGFRTKPAGVQIGDTKGALAWAKAHLPGAVTEAIDRAAVTKALLETGEAVDWAALMPAEETFYIR